MNGCTTSGNIDLISVNEPVNKWIISEYNGYYKDIFSDWLSLQRGRRALSFLSGTVTATGMLS